MADAVPADVLRGWYRDMYLIRRFEEQAAKAYTQRKIIGFCHLYIGQEAVAVGCTAALKPEDTVVTAYRVHGQVLARGAKPEIVMAELFAKDTGICKGVGGSMHMADKDLNFFGGYGIVGAHVPLAVGAGFASWYKEDQGVTIVYLGDGASNQGAFYEGMLLAALWKLPVVFVIENNYYAMGTSLERQAALTDLSKRGEGVGIESWRCDGFDVVEVYENAKKATEHARSGKGPVLLEILCYRYRGHSMSDPAKYRKQGELEQFKQQDCLLLAEQRLQKLGLSEDDLTKIREQVNAEIDEAYQKAEAAPDADPSRLYAFTYADAQPDAPKGGA